MAWNRLEVEATIADYFHMLVMELAGQNYNKSAHRKALLPKLDNRSEGAIERKHQNISAILIELGLPYIAGYKPLGNYQALLKEVLVSRLEADRRIDAAAEVACATPAVSPLITDYSDLVVEPPAFTLAVHESEPAEYFRPNPHKRDYLAKEARNASLGTAGEEFVLNYEHHRLWSLGEKSLADKVEHVAKTKGDGMGYDILSFDMSGEERFIEVKTTAFGKETPFYVSRGEVKFAKQYSKHFHLYRLFNFRRAPKFFDLAGPVEQHCKLTPISYICEFI